MVSGTKNIPDETHKLYIYLGKVRRTRAQVKWAWEDIREIHTQVLATILIPTTVLKTTRREETTSGWIICAQRSQVGESAKFRL